MPLLLVRHAKAKARRHWTQDDRDRPLTDTGWNQARSLVEVLSAYEPRGILSSPYLRCVQTVEPLSKKLGIELDVVEELGEGHPGEATELLRRRAAEGLVACTHGDVVPAVLDGAASDGVQLPSHPEWAKGSTWVLDWGGERFAAATYLRPPG
jgi:phosphohistidine phosphatase SixA